MRVSLLNAKTVSIAGRGLALSSSVDIPSYYRHRRGPLFGRRSEETRDAPMRSWLPGCWTIMTRTLCRPRVLVHLMVVLAMSSSTVCGQRHSGGVTIQSKPQPLVGVDAIEPDQNDDEGAEHPDEPMFEGGLGFNASSAGGLGFGDPLKNNVKEPSCSERTSCKKFHSPITTPGELTLRNCYCDELCLTYDDCCRDFVRHPQSSVETLPIRPDVVACQSLSVRFRFSHGAVDKLVTPESLWSFTVVARCPTNYSEPFIRDKCLLGSSADADLFYGLPVNGRTSKVLYANYYCAICNGDMNVVFWTGQRDVCHDEEREVNATTLEGQATRNAHCDVLFAYPDGYGPRLCKQIRRQCSPDWTDRKMAIKCQDRGQLNRYVYDSTTAFRNKQCAVCNGVREADTTCSDPVDRGNYAPPVNAAPFSILFDLNANTLAFRDNDRPNEPIETVELRSCPLGFVYDPFSEICRIVFCRKGYRLTDAGCDLASDDDDDEAEKRGGDGGNLGGGGGISDERPSSNSGPQTNLTCDGGGPMIRLNASEYRLLSNRSVYVYARDSLLNEDQYDLKPPYLIVCSTFSRHYNVTFLVMFRFDRVQSFLSFVGLIVSLMALLVQFVVYMVFPELRNTPGKCIVCLVVSLFVAQLSFLFVTHDGPACFYTAATMHFGFLAAFFWMNTLAFDIFRTFTATDVASLSSSGSKWKRFLAYSAYAWLCPSLIVGLCVTMDVLRLGESFRPHYGEVGICWLMSQTALIAYFVFPVGVILVVNAVFFSKTIYCICKAARAAAEMASSREQTKGHLFVCIKLFFIMGLTWLFGFLASLTEWTVLWYVFIVLNSFQGAFLCLMFVCTKKVYRLLRKKWSANKSTTSTSPPHNNQKALTNDTLLLSKDDVKVVAKETCM